MSTRPRVWSRFTKVCNGKLIKFRIQELSKDDFEDMFALLFRYFTPEEPLHIASKLTQREEAFEEYKQGFLTISKAMDYQVDACCLDDDDGTGQLNIVGGSVMVLDKKNETFGDIETLQESVQAAEIKKLFEISAVMTNTYKVLEKLDLDSSYNGRAVVVHPEYRGLGIAGELLEVRTIICKERGVPITSAWMTSIGTQKAAAKLGWEALSEISYEDLGKMVGTEFPKVPPSSKLMAKKI